MTTHRPRLQRFVAITFSRVDISENPAASVVPDEHWPSARRLEPAGGEAADLEVRSGALRPANREVLGLTNRKVRASAGDQDPAGAKASTGWRCT